MKAIEQVLIGNVQAIKEIKEYVPDEIEKNKYQQVLECIKLNKIENDNKKITRREYGK